METTENITPTVSMFRDRPKIKKLSSKVSNGKRVFSIGGDARSAWTRRWRDILDAHISDLGGGDCLSEALAVAIV